MLRTGTIFKAGLALILGLALSAGAIGHTQVRRNVKVVVETQQSGVSSQESLQGSGSVIIRRGTVQPSGRVTAGERQTTVQRSSGIFTLVRDGGESILSVATRVPASEVVYYHNYAAGDIERRVVFDDVGTSLRVSATVLPDEQIRVKLTPRISYFSAERAGAIDLTEVTTELVVPNNQPVSLGGATSHIHEVTRQILGYRDRSSSSETNLVVTATIQ
jgi:type II secretory pathway component GspD/PulD (secretin)